MVKHFYFRIDLPVRANLRKCELWGIFPGAKVVRGFNWEWGNQDGGEGNSFLWLSKIKFFISIVILDNINYTFFKIIINLFFNKLLGKIGSVLDIRGWDSESSRSVVNVQWFSGSTNLYRLGYKGNCDIRFVESSSGGYYYPDHLPVLGKLFLQFASCVCFYLKNII